MYGVDIFASHVEHQSFFRQIENAEYIVNLVNTSQESNQQPRIRFWFSHFCERGPLGHLLVFHEKRYGSEGTRGIPHKSVGAPSGVFANIRMQLPAFLKNGDSLHCVRLQPIVPWARFLLITQKA